MSEVIFAGMALFLLRMTSRNEMNLCREDENFAENYYRLFGHHRLPHMDVVEDVFRQLNPEKLETLQVELVKILLKKKVFDPFRHNQSILIAVDATGVMSFDHRHCDHCLEKNYGGYFKFPPKAIRFLRDHCLPKFVLKELSSLTKQKFNSQKEFIETVNRFKLPLETFQVSMLLEQLELHAKTTKYFHQVLEAKIVAPNGFSISIMNEWIENEGEWNKQDCEMRAFQRLSEKLKKDFPRLKICILADGLYPQAPFFKACQKNNWAFLVTLKDESLLSLQEKIEDERKLGNLQKRSTKETDKRHKWERDYEWFNSLSYQDFKKMNYVCCVERHYYWDSINGSPPTWHLQKTTRFVFLSSMKTDYHNVQERISSARLRWKIENEGFNVQKNHGYELNHKFSRTSLEAAKNYYQCLQLAHMIQQLAQLESKMKEWLGFIKMTIKHLLISLLGMMIYAQVDEDELKSISKKRVQYRFT